MRTTLVFPDDLMTEIKIESARRHQTLKTLVPELIRAGLEAQREKKVCSLGDLAERRNSIASAWISNWENLGKKIESKNPDTSSLVSLLEADRGARG